MMTLLNLRLDLLTFATGFGCGAFAVALALVAVH